VSAEGAVTATVIVQLPFAAILPPDSEIVLLPLVAPVTVPLQELLRAGVVATTRPGGKESAKATLLRAVEFAFVIDSERVDVPLGVIVAGENVLAMTGMVMAHAGAATMPQVRISSVVRSRKQIPDDGGLSPNGKVIPVAP
jgi:hypothetical protein